jgi:ribonuclease D
VEFFKNIPFMLTDSFRQSITKDEINQLPVKAFEGVIHVIDSEEALNNVSFDLLKGPFLGFDTETKPTFKKGKLNKVSLLQLSTETDAFLFRLNKIGLPQQLLEILSDREIQKVGVAVNDDISFLRRHNGFKPDGFVDLQPFVKQFDIQDNGLKKLVAIVLGFKISKGQQTSNWEADVLTTQQISYAATDAWVCYEIYKRLLMHPSLQ